MLYLVKKAMSEKIANEKNFFCYPVNYHKTDTAVLTETTEFAIFFTKFFRSIALLFLDLVTIQSIFSLRLWITFVILKSRKNWMYLRAIFHPHTQQCLSQMDKAAFF